RQELLPKAQPAVDAAAQVPQLHRSRVRDLSAGQDRQRGVCRGASRRRLSVWLPEGQGSGGQASSEGEGSSAGVLPRQLRRQQLPLAGWVRRLELPGSADHRRQRILNKGKLMLNRDIYQKDPSTRKLLNEGVASVNDDKTNQALSVLRYELETFVCDGQYERGLEHILNIYLKNIEQAEQPAVWVSGFYGSGKSHLVKMLRALWVDSAFEDGATARGIATLPQSVSDQFKELTIQAKRHGG